MTGEWNRRIMEGYQQYVGKDILLIRPDGKEQKAKLLKVSGELCQFEYIEKTFGRKTAVFTRWINMSTEDYDIRPLR